MARKGWILNKNKNNTAITKIQWNSHKWLCTPFEYIQWKWTQTNKSMFIHWDAIKAFLKTETTFGVQIVDFCTHIVINSIEVKLFLYFHHVLHWNSLCLFRSLMSRNDINKNEWNVIKYSVFSIPYSRFKLNVKRMCTKINSIRIQIGWLDANDLSLSVHVYCILRNSITDLQNRLKTLIA